MPLYEYECESCGRRFERIQKFSDPAVEACPSCSGQAKRQVSSPAVHFKGSGFYITDYAKKGPEKTGGDEKTTKPAESAGDPKGTDAKSGDTAKAAPAATKAETKPETKPKS